MVSGESKSLRRESVIGFRFELDSLNIVGRLLHGYKCELRRTLKTRMDYTCRVPLQFGLSKLCQGGLIKRREVGDLSRSLALSRQRHGIVRFGKIR